MVACFVAIVVFGLLVYQCFLLFIFDMAFMSLVQLLGNMI